MSLEDIEKELYGQGSNKPVASPDLVEEKEKSIKTESESVHVREQGYFGRSPRFDPWGTDANRNQKPQQKEESIEKNQKNQKTSIGKIVFICAIAILVVLAGFASYYLYQYFTTKDIVVTITVPTKTLVGEPFTARLSFENISQKSLTAPHIALTLPEGIISVDEPSKRVLEQDTHDIAPQETIQTNYQLMVLGKALQTYTINGSVTYGYESSSLSSRFEKRASASIVTTDSVLGIDVSAPTQALNGQEFNMSVKYQNISERALQNVSIAFDFPQGFTVTGSDSLLQDNAIIIDEIPAHGEGEVIVSGYMIGDEYSYFTIPVSARMNVGAHAAEIAAKTISISITPSPLVITINRQQAIEGQDIVYPGDKLSYTISCINNGDIPLADVVVTASLIGDAFDISTINGTGYLRDADKTYIWTAAQVPSLKEIAPHAIVQIPLKVSIRDNAGINGNGTPETITLKVRATSPTIPPTIAAKETIGMGQFSSVIGGALGITQSAYFVEPTVGITNRGSLPPRVGEEIQYTIHWKLLGAGDFEGTAVKATLPPGFSWTGKLKVVGTDSVPEYNDRTQEITWTIPKISSKDLESQPPEAIFQIAFTPSSQDSGNVFSLISDAQLTSTETLSGKTISVTARALTSRQLSDRGLKEGYHRVLPAQP